MYTECMGKASVRAVKPVCLAFVLLAAGCATRPSTLPDDDDLVVVKSVRLPVRDWLPWYTRCAEHAWVDVKDTGGWHRVEWNQRLDHVLVEPMSGEVAARDLRWEEGVAVLACYRGERARDLATAILATAEAYPDATNYRAWPGPNSNTFVEWLAQETGLPLVLPPSAIGKDYAPWLRAGLTSSRTGFEVETLLLGAQIGLCEGAELHLFGLTLGVGLWPPVLKLPFLPAIPSGWFAPGNDPTGI